MTFVHLLCTLNVNNQQLNSNWSITWSFRLTHRLCVWRAMLTDLTIESGIFWIEAAIDCLLSVSEWLLWNVAARILIGTYNFRTAIKTRIPLRIFVFRNPWYTFAESWGSVEHSLRNTGLEHWCLIFLIACHSDAIALAKYRRGVF
jgi:hypothetical protein